jgi:hypothetical protein
VPTQTTTEEEKSSEIGGGDCFDGGIGIASEGTPENGSNSTAKILV